MRSSVQGGKVGRAVKEALLILACVMLIATAGNSFAGQCRLDEVVAQTGMATIAYSGTDTGKGGVGLRLTSFGKIRDGQGQDLYTVWRVRNCATVDRTVNLHAYGGGFNLDFTAPARSETFVRSDRADGAATHKLMYNGSQIDVKASSQSDFSYDLMIPCDGEDTNPPQITVTQPADGAAISDPMPLITVSFNDETAIDTASLSVLMDGVDRTADFSVTDTGASYQVAQPLSTGAHTISAAISDSAGNSASAASNYTVINSPPVAEDDALATEEDVAVAVISVLANDSDINADALSIDGFTQASHGTVGSNGDGTLSYSPDTDFFGDDGFTYTITDGAAASNPATVTVNINPVPDPPVADAGPDQSVFRGDTVILDGSGAGDVDGDPLSHAWSFTSKPAGSAAVLSDAAAVNPSFPADAAGEYQVQLVVNDGTFDSAADTVRITAEIRTVAVPDVTGLAQAEAEAQIMAAGLTLGAVTTDYHATVADGHVIGQQPAAGTVVDETTAVDLGISLGPAPVPSVTISAIPDLIAPGQSASLSWTTSNADTVTIDQGIGTVAANGTLSVAPAATTIYTIFATGPGGTATSTVTITVNQPPALVLVEPDGIDDRADAGFIIAWDATDPDNDAAIALFYDLDAAGADGIPIAAGISEDAQGAAGTYAWDTSSIEEGDYFIYAVIDDGVHSPVTVYSTGALTVDHPPYDLQETKFIPDGLEAGDRFGEAVAVSGDVAIIGATGDDDGAQNAGAAYILRYVDGQWVQEVKLTPDNPIPDGGYGTAVDIDGDTAIIGRGSAYIATYTGAGWVQQKLTIPNEQPEHLFGMAVAVEGSYAAVGAPRAVLYGIECGLVYIFKREGTVWQYLQTLYATNPNHRDNGDLFGSSLSMDGNTLVVGAPGTDDNRGAAYEFTRLHVYTGGQRIQPPDGIAGERFGETLVTQNGVMLIGAPYAVIDEVTPGGAVYAYNRVVGRWNQEQVIAHQTPAAGDRYGQSLAMDGSQGVVGHQPLQTYDGIVHLVERQGVLWFHNYSLNAGGGFTGDSYGYGVDLDSGRLIVSAPTDDTAGASAGAVYVYPNVPYGKVALTAQPEAILIKESVTLSWTSHNMDTFTIEPGNLSYTSDDTITVTPGQTTEYTITAGGPYGIATDTVTVRVTDPDNPPTVSLTADDDMLRDGDTTHLAWESTDAGSVIIEPDIGEVGLSGLIAVSPAVTTTYTVTAEGNLGSVTASETVTVNQAPGIIIGQPDGAGDVAHQAYTIRWHDYDADDDAAIALYYDTDASGADGTLIVDGVSEDPDGAADTYQWDTRNMPEGVYYIYASVEDGVGAPVISYSRGPVTIDHSTHAGTGAVLSRTDPLPPYARFGDPLAVNGDDAIVAADGAVYFYRRTATGWEQREMFTNTALGIDGLPLESWNCMGETMNIPPQTVRSGQEIDVSLIGICGDFDIRFHPQDGDSPSSFIISAIEVFEDGKWKLKTSDQHWRSDWLQYLPGLGWIADIFVEVGMQGDYIIKSPDDQPSGNKLKLFFEKTGPPLESDAISAVAISDEWAVVGLPKYQRTYVDVSGEWQQTGGGQWQMHMDGAVLVFKRSGEGWAYHTLLDSPILGGNFAASVAVDGDKLVVGAPEARHADDVFTGKAFVYMLHGGGLWKHFWTLSPSGIPTAESGETITMGFGRSVGITGDVIAVGAPLVADANGNPSGAVYIYEYYLDQAGFEGGAGVFDWIERQKITPDSADADGTFGRSLSLRDEQVIIGHPGAAVGATPSGKAAIYGRIGQSWFKEAVLSLENPAGYEDFGAAVSIHNDLALVGAPYAQKSGAETTGGAFIYKRNGNFWEPFDALFPDAASAGDRIGAAVGLYNDAAFVGAPTGAYASNGSGEVYIYQLPAVTASITAAPKVSPDGQFALTWQTRNAESCVIEPGLGTVDVNGTATATVASDHTFILTASGPLGTATDRVTVKVGDPAPELSVSVSPQTINFGDSATLAWSAAGADEVTIDPLNLYGLAADGTLDVTPQETTTYFFTAYGNGKITTAAVTLTVIAPPRVSITAVPGRIFTGESATLSWESAGADTISIDQGIGPVEPYGEMLVAPDVSTTYTITAGGPGGTVTDSFELLVNQPPPAIVSFTATPDTILEGESATLSWTTEFADSVVIIPAVGEVAVNGNVTVQPEGDVTFILTASGPGGPPVTREVSVSVGRQPGIYYEYDSLGRIRRIIRVPR